MKGIKAVVFDLGNVLIDLNYGEIEKSFEEVAQHNLNKIAEMVVNLPILQQFEIGEINEHQFRKAINSFLGTQLKDDEFDFIWNKMLGSIPLSRIEKVLELKKNYTVCILSNTNEIHERKFNEMLFDLIQRNDFNEIVHKVYYSHIIHDRKPNLTCYRYVINDLKLQPYQILFLDDRSENVAAAQHEGMQAIQIIEPDRQFESLF